MSQLFWTTLVAAGLSAGVPLMFTALGESIAERAGVLNIGLEGMMLIGAYCGFLGAHYGHSVWVGYIAGMAGGMAGSAVMVVLCIWLGLDQIVVGIAITLAGEGITSVLYQSEYASSQPRLGATPSDAIPLLDRIPVLGKPLNGQFPLFSQPMLVYFGLAFAALLAWVFRSTNIGLNLRAAGEKPEALDAAGVSVVRTRTYAELTAGALTGLGGAYLAVVTGAFQPFFTTGQGFMAIVIAMLARGRPLGVVVGSFLFGTTISLSPVLGAAGVTNIPDNVVHALPFVAIILALMLFSRRAYLPPALALPYVRGAR